MKCPNCESDKNRVIDTRKYDTVNFRIRLCEQCGCIIRTEEQMTEYRVCTFNVTLKKS